MFPKGYEWLGGVGTLPKMITVALPTVGVVELAGEANSPTIMGWAKETSLSAQGYTADSIPWCGLWAALIASRAGYSVPTHPLWALNWGGFGTKGLQPCLGDVLVFVRPGGGHVGLYIAEDAKAYHVLGGNTRDAVGIARIDKERLRFTRSPKFMIGRPPSSRPYIVAATGKLSTNEA